jgi:hypothetical protein
VGIDDSEYDVAKKPREDMSVNQAAEVQELWVAKDKCDED